MTVIIPFALLPGQTPSKSLIILENQYVLDDNLECWEAYVTNGSEVRTVKWSPRRQLSFLDGSVPCYPLLQCLWKTALSVTTGHEMRG